MFPGMKPQTQIKRILSEPANIALVVELLSSEPELGRTRLADRVCGLLGFRDPAGRLQRSCCIKALRKLEQQGHLRLPPGHGTHSSPRPRRLGAPVPEPVGVPHDAGLVRGLKLVLVDDEELLKTWNELMAAEHPLGAGPFVGRQLRYLVGSEHGWLGGIGFAAAALYLQARDAWIGWTHEERSAHLDKVVGLARLLIRPCVDCANLASRVLGMCAKAMVVDFERKYGYAPLLLETFVDASRFAGTCFRAANWTRIGETQGRGRYDRANEAAKGVKDIYVYPLAADFRERLGLPAGRGLGPLGPADGVDGDGWAEQEFGGARFGDIRATNRLVSIAAKRAEKPDKPWSDVVGGDWAETKAYYRFIERPDDSPVTAAGILQPHRERTIQRMQAQRTVLCVQDGTDLDYSAMDACEGLHRIGKNQTGTESMGLHLHTTFAMTTQGIPLGVLRGDFPEPKPKPPQVVGKDGKLRDRRHDEIPIEGKKTFCWIEGFRDLDTAAAAMPGTRIVSVMDREADLFELFDEQRRSPKLHLLVRAMHDRKTATGEKLFAAVTGTPVQARCAVHVPRRSARRRKGKHAARPKRPARTAWLDVRYAKVELKAPDDAGMRGKEPITVWIVHAVEASPPPGAEPVEWFLLTTIPVDDPETAMECVRWYCLRWRVEDWHRVLKSACRVEDARHRTAERLKRSIAINMVVAWRIMLMTLLGRETPELPPEVLFSDVEITVLSLHAKKNG